MNEATKHLSENDTAGWDENSQQVAITWPHVDSAAMELIETLRQFGAEFPALPMALAAIEDALDAAAARPVVTGTTPTPALALAAARILSAILAGNPTPTQAGIRAYCFANDIGLRPRKTQCELAAELGVSQGTISKSEIILKATSSP